MSNNKKWSSDQKLQTLFEGFRSWTKGETVARHKNIILERGGGSGQWFSCPIVVAMSDDAGVIPKLDKMQFGGKDEYGREVSPTARGMEWVKTADDVLRSLLKSKEAEIAELGGTVGVPNDDAGRYTFDDGEAPLGDSIAVRSRGGAGTSIGWEVCYPNDPGEEECVVNQGQGMTTRFPRGVDAGIQVFGGAKGNQRAQALKAIVDSIEPAFKQEWLKLVARTTPSGDSEKYQTIKVAAEQMQLFPAIKSEWKTPKGYEEQWAEKRGGDKRSEEEKRGEEGVGVAGKPMGGKPEPEGV